MNGKLSIRVNVAERYYPLTIKAEDEEIVRKAARIINDRIVQYKEKNYSGKDQQDYLAMAGLSLVIRLLELENDTALGPVIQEIDDMSRKIEAALDQK